MFPGVRPPDPADCRGLSASATLREMAAWSVWAPDGWLQEKIGFFLAHADSPSAPMSPKRPRESDQVRAIPRWKIVGGAFVHFAFPVYLLAALFDGLRLAATSAGASGWSPVIAGVLRDSAYGLAIYAGLALVATGLALTLDRIGQARRHARDPRADHAAQFRLVLVRARGRLGARADAALSELAAIDWTLPDPRIATLARHCEALINASLHADDQAIAPRRTANQARTAEALEGLALAAKSLHDEAGAARDAEAAMLARFVVARYGSSTLDQSTDSAGETN